MYMVLVGIVIGVLIWNAITLICYLGLEDDEKVALIGAGIVGLVCLSFCCIIRFIKIAICNSKYCSALIDPNGKPCYCGYLSYKKEKKLFDKGYKWNLEVREKYTVDDGWNPNVCVYGTIPNLRYTPIQIAKQEGWYKLKI